MPMNTSFAPDPYQSGWRFVDDNGRITTFSANAPAPAVPYWNTSLNGIHRGIEAINKLGQAFKDGVHPKSIFEGDLVSNIPLGNDVRLKSSTGFWIGDGFSLDRKFIKNEGLLPKDANLFEQDASDYDVFISKVKSGNNFSTSGLFVQAEEIIIRATGFLRYEGALGYTRPSYEEIVEARKNGTEEELSRRYNSLEMQVNGYSPAACLIWIMDAKKIDNGAVIEYIGKVPAGSSIDVDSGTISGFAMGDASKAIKSMTKLFEEEDRDGSILGSSKEGYFSTGTAMGDGGYFVYPVFDAKKELIGHVIDLCSALGEQEENE